MLLHLHTLHRTGQKCYDDKTDVSLEGGDKLIIIITGASHTGKTVLAQRMLEKYIEIVRAGFEVNAKKTGI